MAYTLLGRIRPVYRGAWSSAESYTVLEMVKSTDGRAAYIALKDVPKGIPVTNTSYWGTVLDVSDVLDAVDAAADRANTAASLAPMPLALTTHAEPAMIWPDAGSPLRPVIQVQAAQNGSGEPYPGGEKNANIRPITGLTSVKVTRCGRNLVDMAAMYTNRDSTNVEHGENIIRVYTTANDTYQGARTSNMILRASVTYTLSAKLTALEKGTVRLGFRDAADNSFLSDTSIIFSETGGQSVMFTLKSDTKAYLSALVTWSTAEAGDATFADIQLEVGASATEYEPFHGNTFSRSFGRTVYGGSLDMDSGVLTITHGYIALTGDEHVESRTGSDGLTYYLLSNIASSAPAAGLLTLICSHYPTTNSVYSGTQGVRFTDSHTSVMLRDTRFQNNPDSESLKMYFEEQAAAGTPVQLCWELAQPEIVHLSATEIDALEGANFVYADGSGMTVTYNKSLAREHEELTARLAALEAAAANNM